VAPSEPAGSEDPAPEDGPARRLVAYGTLVPGGSNHHVVAHLGGTWEPATVRGHLEWLTPEIPRLRWDDDGPELAAQLLTSVALPHAWPALDEFEGDAYVRAVVPATTATGVVAASCYVRPGGPGPAWPSRGGWWPPAAG
jgi:gamma-glutamylcyclotransferase (GGCT)/AIG2-like uncharacterized protein YtfP